MGLSKNTFNNKTCLIEYYLKNNSLPAVSGILNSKRKDNDTRVDRYNIESMEFDVRIPGSKIALTKRIQKIKDCKTINIKDWIEEFTSISKSLEWSPEDQKIVLNEVLLDPHLRVVNDKKSITESLKFLKIKAGERINSAEFIHKLKIIRQKDFETITEFYEEIRTNLDLYANIEALTSDEYRRRLRESFFDNLSFYTKRKLKDLRISEVEESVEYLMDLENDLRERMNFFATNSRKNKQDRNSFKDETERKTERSEKHHINKRWCQKCNSTTHDEKYCWYKDRELKTQKK